jgi:hypothetical protein
VSNPGVLFASGITSSAGEQCIVTGTSGIQMESCLEAIAAGDGREVMQFDKVSFCGPRFLSVCVGLLAHALCRAGR